NKDSDWGYAGRATFAPLQESGSVVHLGASYSHIEYEEDFDDGAREERFRERTSRFTDRPVIVHYDEMESANTYGLEAATIQGPFSLQGEYYHRTLNRDGYKDADVDGWYVLG